MNEGFDVKIIAELSEKLGLSKPESDKYTFFHGNFGFSFSLTTVILFLLFFLIIFY